jgi:hypothetical protein
LETLSRSALVTEDRLGGAETPIRVGAILICTVLFMLGLTLGAARIGHRSARLLLRLTRRPSATIAVRQTLADPYEASRTYAVIFRDHRPSAVGAECRGIRAARQPSAMTSSQWSTLWSRACCASPRAH